MNLFKKKYSPEQLEKIYNEHQSTFEDFYFKERHRPTTHKELERCYVDLAGKVYYRIPKGIEFPLERHGKAKHFLMLMKAGLSDTEIEKIIASMESLLPQITAGKNAAKLGYLIEEMRRRKDIILHTELLYNYQAVHWIRQDESIDKYSNEIQMQKVDQFKKEVAEKGARFFFATEELKSILAKLNWSNAEWETYWHESLVEQRELDETLKIISSSKDSFAQKETLKSN